MVQFSKEIRGDLAFIPPLNPLNLSDFFDALTNAEFDEALGQLGGEIAGIQVLYD